MWFKNLITFQLTESFDLKTENFEKALNEFRFQPCLSTQATSIGFSSPSGLNDGTLVHAANGFLMVALKIQEKIVPASVVKEMVDEQVKAIEEKENKKVRKKAKDAIKDEIYHNLLPKAFSKHAYIYGYIDTKANLLVVDAASAKKAELLSVQLRKALGSFKIQTPDIISIPLLLTNWLSDNQYPDDLVIEDSCVLKDPNDATGTIRCQKQNLLSGEMAQLIENGREVVQLGLTWKEQISFVMKDDFSIKSVKFLEAIQDQANDLFTETESQRFDADFTIMTESLHQFLVAMFDLFANEPLVINAKKDQDVLENISLESLIAQDTNTQNKLDIDASH